MADGGFEMEYPVVEEDKTDEVLEMEYPVVVEDNTNDVLGLEYPVVEEDKTNEVLGMEYPVVEEHIVEFHEIFEEDQANREDNNNDRRLYCKYCGKNFKSHNYVKMHERWHRGELNHHCPECNRAFRYPSELKKHSTIHTGQLPYKCEDCDLRFNKAQAAHQHRLRDHVGMIQDSKQLHQPIIYQMNNNYQPVSFEVILPNLHTPQQRTGFGLERGHDSLAEEFTVDSYEGPGPTQCSSADSYARASPSQYARAPPSQRSSQDSYARTPPSERSFQDSYARTPPMQRSSTDSYARPPPMQRSSVIRPNYVLEQEVNNRRMLEISNANRNRWEEGRDGKIYNDATEEGREAADVDEFMGNGVVEENYDSHVHNMEECKACRKIMEYKNKIEQLRNHSCARH